MLALSFHVDYWNDLGWRDPYSDAAYSARQRAYARRLDGRAYTPQLVVNGTAGFVGSRRSEADRHVAEALGQSPDVAVALTARADGGELVVEHAVSDAPRDAVLHLAVVERSTAQDVRRGENRGRRLAHTNVVRVFETTEAASGTRRLTLPDGLAASAVRVIGWVQEGEVGPILAAARAE